MAKTIDPVVDQMNSFALALLVAAREAKVETAAGEMDHLSIAERVNVFREVARWISIKNRLPEPSEGGDLDDYRARLGVRDQARELVERGKSIAERAVITAPAVAAATATGSAIDNAYVPISPAGRSPAVGTPRKAFNADGSPARGNPSLRPQDLGVGGPSLDALRARIPTASGSHAGGVRSDRGGAADPPAGRPRGLRGGSDGAARSEPDDAGGGGEL